MKNLHQYAVQILGKALEDIDFATQLTAALQKGTIKPEYLPKPLYVDMGSKAYQIDRDWTPYSLQNNLANMIRINTISYTIITCKESYRALFIGPDKLESVTQESNPDIYAAQIILMLIRNALGHFKSPSGTLISIATWELNNNKYIGIFNIKEIDVTLDTTELAGKRFEWDCFKNGFKDFRKILSYLRKYHQIEAKKFVTTHMQNISSNQSSINT